MTDRITISWTLLFLAVFHCSIWSVGVFESPAKDFYVRHTKNVKGEGGVPERSIDERFLYLQEQLLVDERLFNNKKPVKKKDSKPLKLPNLASNSISAQEQTVTVFLPSNEDSFANDGATFN